MGARRSPARVGARPCRARDCRGRRAPGAATRAPPPAPRAARRARRASRGGRRAARARRAAACPLVTGRRRTASQEAVRVTMAAAANDPGAASGVLAPPSCGVPSGTPRRSSLRLPLSLPGSFASLAMIYPDGLLPRAEACARGEPAPGQELRDGEPASPLELDLEQAERPRAGRERGAMDLEELPLQRGERRRRRGQRTYLALELDRRAAPVETALLALDARREGDARGGLRDRTQRAGLEAVDRLADGLRTETC